MPTTLLNSLLKNLCIGSLAKGFFIRSECEFYHYYSKDEAPM
jgi:hypothetical protein